MRYAVFIDPDGRQILWSTVEELVNMNYGRFLDGAETLGLLRLCATPEDAKRAVASIDPLSRAIGAKIAQIVGGAFKRTA